MLNIFNLNGRKKNSKEIKKANNKLLRNFKKKKKTNIYKNIHSINNRQNTTHNNKQKCTRRRNSLTNIQKGYKTRTRAHKIIHSETIKDSRFSA